MSKVEIESQMDTVSGLKTKLCDAMETLKKNSQTIELLNNSLTEA
jgi:hypothetical protein